MPAETAGRGDPATQHRRQRRLVDLYDQLRTRDPARHARHVLGDALGQGLGEIATGSVVGEHPVATRALHRRGQRQWSGHLQLERSLEALGVLLQRVEVLGEQRAGPALVGAGCVGEPPPRGLQIGREAAEQPDRPADHAGSWAARRQLGQVRQVGQLVHDQPYRLVHVVTRHRTDAGRVRLAGGHPSPGRALLAVTSRAGEPTVALPTTRVPA